MTDSILTSNHQSASAYPRNCLKPRSFIMTLLLDKLPYNLPTILHLTIIRLVYSIAVWGKLILTF